MKRNRPSRCWPNPFTTGGRVVPDITIEDAWAQVLALLPALDACAERGDVPKSTGRPSRDYSVYTGLGGVAVAFLRVGLFCREVRRDLAAADEYVRRSLSVAQTCLEREPQTEEVSFFCGTPGALALACVACELLGEAEAANRHLRALIGWAQAAQRHRDDELLFGRAGYIYAILFVRNQAPAITSEPSFAQALDRVLRDTAERLVAVGVQIATRTRTGWPLMWHCFGEPYIGAAHGPVGILAMLFHCYRLLSVPSQELVVGTMRALLASRFPSGNLPIQLGDSRDEHVHWCHGAPGLPAMLAAAVDALGDEGGGLRAAALQAGEIIWQRGMILKGNGLCHGVAGNGYAFLSLLRFTGDGSHLHRAHAFATILNDPDFQGAVARQPDPQRRVVGQPDSPQSLMEGAAGVLCFLMDVAQPDRAAFPGWELSP